MDLEAKAISSGHSELDCQQCHPMVADITGEVGIRKPDSQCRGCHESGNDGSDFLKLTFHADKKRACSDCHKYHEQDRIVIGEDEYEFLFSEYQGPELCNDCHGPASDLGRLSAGHRSAAQVFHEMGGPLSVRSSSEACLICHDLSDQNESEVYNAARSLIQPETIPQIDPHSSHPVGIKVSSGTGEPGNWIRLQRDSQVKLPDGRIECLSCHSLTGNTRALLAGFETQTELCLACHDVD